MRSIRPIAALLLGCCCLAAAVAAESRPNIVLILADDLGYSDVGCYGGARGRTPNIDRLAAEGSRFTSFYVAQAVCTASRAALLTGCYANRVSMSGALNHLSTTGIHPREKLLSEALKEAGYATAAFGKWHLGNQAPFWPTRRGFDEFFGIPYSNDNGPLHPVTPGLPGLPLYDGDKAIETDPDQSQFTRRITERAVDFIARQKDGPFFLYVPQVMPHVPIFASERFKGRSGQGLYADVIEELDWSVGEIVAAVEKHGLRENTLILFASDNGPFLSYGEHAGRAVPFREGKLTTFEGGVRVPLIASWPGRVPGGRKVEEMASAMDLFATLIALGGAQPPKTKIDGTDLSGLLLGKTGAKGREVFWYYSGEELHAVREDHWKLHLPHEYLAVAGAPGRGGKPSNWGKMKPLSHEVSGIRGIASRHGYRVEELDLALYNVRDDPGEQRNVARNYPEVVARLQKIAAEARADLGDSLHGVKGPGVRPAGDAKAMELGR